MRGMGLVVLVAWAVSGCVTPVVLQHPTTREVVNCTLEAERLTYAGRNPSIGTDVPWRASGSAPLQAFDLERRCVGALLNEGFVCVSGCADSPADRAAAKPRNVVE